MRSGREAQVSAQHAVAVSLQRGRAGLDEFSDEAVLDASLRELGSKLVFVDDPRFAVDSAQVNLRLRGGSSIDSLVEHAYGGGERPMSDADLELKLRQLMRHAGVLRDPSPLIDAVWALLFSGRG